MVTHDPIHGAIEMNRKDSETVGRVEKAIKAIQAGRMVILVDDEDRENEGDLAMAAEMVTPEAIGFMAVHGRGLICLALTSERCDQLRLPAMVEDNRSGFGTAFTVSVEAAHGVTTGISAADRAHTIEVAVAPDAKAGDLVRPGHVFPLRARPGGVLVRTGQTEGSVDLARLAGLEPAGVICEIMNDDGTMARLPDLETFAARHELMIVSVADLIRYRLFRERLVERVAELEVNIDNIGQFRAFSYRNAVDDLEHLALVKGTPTADVPVLGRVHQESVLGDVFRCANTDSRWRIECSLRAMEEAGCGVMVYLQKPAPRLAREMAALGARLNRGGEAGRVAAVIEGEDKVDPATIGLPPDLREFGIGAQILLDQGVEKLRLITSSPAKIKGIEGYGLRVVEHITLPPRSQS